MRDDKVMGGWFLAAMGCAFSVGCSAHEDQTRRTLSSSDDNFEVWLVDQSNSPGKTFGGTLYIYDGEDVMGADAASATPSDVVAFDGAVAQLCNASTGANPVRPHMMVFNSTDSHGILSFVASGHVVLFDGPTRQPLACFRTQPGTGGARQAHAAFPTADDQYIVVANQNGKLLERIRTDYSTGTFVHEPAATLDLVGCFTPHGVPCQAAGIRPDNAPICPVALPNGQIVVTLRGGGMFVVDPTTTPMSIVAEYDRTNISGNGCGGAIVQDTLFITSGGGTAANLYTYEVYALPTSGYSAANPVNTPAPVTVDSDDADHRDAHGVTPARGASAEHLWVADRGLGLITTYDATSFARLTEIPLAATGAAKITPDLLDINPQGNRVFASLRGPNPLSGDAHVSVGSVPGLGIFRVTESGANGALHAIVPISNVSSLGVETADAHGVQVRRK
ncbi:MAG: hypothetical protein M4D80_26520 [Myxococcota bacterium]|nr:hypothetical protein [Myxococcota bacterium]